MRYSEEVGFAWEVKSFPSVLRRTILRGMDTVRVRSLACTSQRVFDNSNRGQRRPGYPATRTGGRSMFVLLRSTPPHQEPGHRTFPTSSPRVSRDSQSMSRPSDERLTEGSQGQSPQYLKPQHVCLPCSVLLAGHPTTFDLKSCAS